MYSVPPVVMIMLMSWLPPNVWLHGSQSTMTGRALVRNGHTCSIICMLAVSIRCVFSTPLGIPVEPEVKRIFAIPSGASPANAAARPGPGAVAARSESRRAPGRSPAATIAGTSPIASSAGPNRPASSANTAPGAIRSVTARIRA